jgi:amino acid adenylation domain-containing protein
MARPSSTIIETVRQWAADVPTELAYRFIAEDGGIAGALTYAELAGRLDAVAARLSALAARGDRALLVYPAGSNFVSAFLGCLAAGIVAVPVFLPRNRKHMQRLLAIARVADAQLLLTEDRYASRLGEWLAAETGEGLSSLRIVSTDGLPSATESFALPVPGDLAYLQFTSGSTATPKGVMVSHHNLHANANDMRRGQDLSRDSVGVTWMPHFHDMGLVEGLMTPLVTGFPGTVMAPMTFVQQPFRWLEAISRFRGTTSGGPNFAFDLCVERINAEQRAQLDLSSWRTAAVGAEPVRAETLRRFHETFASCGYRATVPRPGYGLAEGTLVLSIGPADAKASIIDVDAVELTQGRVRIDPPAGARRVTLVEAGQIGASSTVVIVDPATAMPCAANVVGEIWARGEGIAGGYWQNPAATVETFGGTLRDDDGHRYLRTGDLGFRTANGELFITGRIKDVIIVAGANHYPQDLEATAAAAHPALNPAAAAAFMLTPTDEQLCLAIEVRRTRRSTIDIEEVYRAVARAVADEHDLAVERLVLLQPGAMPKTTSGKIQRSACRALVDEPDPPVVVERWRRQAQPISTQPVPSAANIVGWLTDWVARRCGVPVAAIDPARPFAEYGLVSRDAVALSGELGDWLGRPLQPTLAYDNPSISAIEAFLGGAARPQASAAAAPAPGDAGPIAVVGMACRMPGADGPDALWRLLIEGRDAIGPMPAGRWPAAVGAPDRGGFLDRIDAFDAEFFGIAPREAALMDPQQRLLLELGWEALEDAQIAPDRLAGTATGVFVGISTNDYAELAAGLADGRQAHAGTGNALSIAANRLSYALDLRGPSMAIDTACSSSLVALHVACQSLRRGECSLALVGGVNLVLTPRLSRVFSAAGMLAADGRCKTFDAAADGYGRGEGGGVVVLKPLAMAQAAGDRVLAVIRGSAVNQDGRSNGLTAPNGTAQRRVIADALGAAGVRPAEISYVEAHGTGTPLGDPIEVAALGEVMLAGREPDRPCYLGSIKANIGHLEAGAGIAGLIKSVLVLHHGTVPPQVNFAQLNPQIALDGTPMRIATQPVPLPSGQRFAGVSAFGFGGTNAHAVLEAAPSAGTAATEAARPEVLVLSARTPAALRELAARHAAALSSQPSLASLGRAAAIGRVHFPHRLAIAGDTADAWASGLRSFVDGKSAAGVRVGRAGRPRVAFLVTGQGAQFTGMGQGLYESEPVFRAAIDRCEELLRPYLDAPLRAVLAEDAKRLDRTLYAQPALFAVGYATTRLWQSIGIEPDVMIGHSVGEYVAACVAGVFDLADGLRLIAARARLMDGLRSPGAMIAVAMPAPDAIALVGDLADRVAPAADNADNACVLSGDASAIAEVEGRLKARGIAATRLRVSHAFHSPLMDPILDDFAREAGQVAYRAPQRPVVSNLTGALAGAEMASAEYWVQHLRKPVRFREGIRALAGQGVDTVIEVGPRRVLLDLARAGLQDDPLLLASAAVGETGPATFARSLGALHVAGAPVDWRAVYAGRGTGRAELPGYPFQRRQFWLSGVAQSDGARGAAHPLLGEAIDLAPEGDTRIWNAVLDDEHVPYLDDHCVETVRVFPAAGYIEIAVAAGRTVLEVDSIALDSLAFAQPMVFEPGAARLVQTRLVRNADAFSFSIHSKPKGGGAGTWTRHVSGVLRPGDVAGDRLEIEALSARCPEIVEGGAFYETWRARGNHWGPAFQGLDSLWVGKGEALARITVPDAVRDQAALYRTHPGLLDASGQPLALLGGAGSDSPFMAYDLARFVSHADWRGGPFWSHVVLRADQDGRGVLAGSIRVADESGRILAEVDGLRFKFLSLAAPKGPQRWLYQVASAPHRAVAAPPMRWSVIGDADADALVSALVERGHAAQRSAPEGPFESDRVVALCPGLSDTISLAQRLAAQKAGPRLWLVTRSRAISAFGRSFAAEHPDRWAGTVEIEARAQGAAQRLADLLIGAGAEDRLLLTETEPRAQRLVPFAVPAAAPYVAKPEALYVVTGGLGDLGLRIAGWLADRGARRVALLNRAALPERDAWPLAEGRLRLRIDAVVALEARGVEVDVVALDTADAKALADWSSRAGTVAGVVHAAGTVDLKAIDEIAPGDLDRAIAGKAYGARALAQAFAGRDLDFILMFGSASSFIDSPRLSLYAAANGWLDDVCADLRGKGVNALSVAWGAWEKIGLAARSGMLDGERAALRAFGTIDEASGVALFDQLVQLAVPGVAVLPTDWASWARRFPALAAAPFYSGVAMAGAAASDGANAVPALRDLEPALRVPKLLEWLDAELRKVLHWSEGALDHECSLQQLGLDSLMAVDLRGRIERALNVVVPTVELVRGPTLRGLAELVVAKLDRQEPADVPEEEIASADDGPAPLSYGQQAQWLLHRLAPQSSAYHVSFTARIVGRIERAKLEQAAQALLDRHEALRTVYDFANGEVRQIVQPSGTCDVAEIDARALSREELAAAVRADYARPFDLSAGPLLRLRLYRTAADEQVLLIAVHHIACDGWSLWVILRDLGAMLEGDAGRLPRLRRRFVDAVRAERRLLDGAEGGKLWDYWRNRLADRPPATELPTDRRRPPVASSRGASVPFLVEAELTEALRALSRRCGATLYATVLAAFEVLVQRISGQGDLLIGTPTAGRGDPAYADVVGTFVNPVVLRLDASANPSFVELIARSRETVLQALEHQALPFPLLVERLRPARDPARSPLFQIDFAWQRPHEDSGIVGMMVAGDAGRRMPWGGVTLAPYPMAQQEGQFDLVLEVAELPDRLPGSFKYNADLFEPARIAAMAEQFTTLLRAIVATPEAPIADLPLALEPAVPQSFTSGVPVPAVEDGTVIDRIRRVAHDHPDASAVICGETSVSYRELMTAATDLAGRLVRAGFGSGRRVGLLADSSEAVIGMVGIMLAGAAYVPLDPGYPDERLRHAIADAGVAIVVARDPADTARLGRDLLVMTIGSSSTLDGATALPGPSPQDEAYVIYTSGSTGRPKGVAVTHANLAYSTFARLGFYDVAPQRYLILSSISFDSSVAGLFWTLACGGALVLPPRAMAPDATQLAGEIRRHAVTHMLCIPSLFGLLLRHANEADLASLRVVIVAGEACRSDLVAAHFARLPGVALVNEYGPTEATVWCTAHRCTLADADNIVPIGRPIPGARIHILDEHGRSLPIGVPGEIHVGGPGVTAGYIGQAEQTAERFVPDPFASVAGAKLYRTGDRGRWRADGTIDFLGRADNQVKLRGFRIELGEIEAALTAQPGIRNAAVALREGTHGAQLAAYLVSDGDVDETSLSAALRERLPAFMIPSSFTRLAAMPLTHNGKTDREALPAPAARRSGAATMPPLGGLERAVADVWRDMLGVDPGRHDSFFDLGGHSLLIVECQAALERRFEVKLSVVDMFAQPTVAALAGLISARMTSDQPKVTAVTSDRAGQRARQEAARTAQRAERRRSRGAD